MKIESFSIKSVTVSIFALLGVIAIIISLSAGNNFRQAALDSQASSLSRVIEVASKEILDQVRGHAFDLGMKLGHSRELIAALRAKPDSEQKKTLVQILDDPFINGFVGFSKIDLVKLRVFDLNLNFISESNSGIEGLDAKLDRALSVQISERKKVDRLKAVDALWISPERPLLSTVVPVGGLRPIGYLEIVVDPAFNLPEVGRITETDVHIHTEGGIQAEEPAAASAEGFLPVHYTLHASDGSPAFTVVSYENIANLNQEIVETRLVLIGAYLALTLVTLLSALFLFKKFLFSPVSSMIEDMDRITHGKLDLTVNDSGLKEFHLLARAFNSMAEQVRIRTADLERLLDLDDNALMCFDHDKDAVYFNDGAAHLLGYGPDEISDLDLSDFFANDIGSLIGAVSREGVEDQKSISAILTCKHKKGHVFEANASIKVVSLMGKEGLAIAINSNPSSDSDLSEKEDQRFNAVEQTISHLLDLAKSNPGLVSGLGPLELIRQDDVQPAEQKQLSREHVVKVMNLALASWTQVTGKNKVDLAEESRIWPVYMDKSTPTTRTLDKYLNVERCPKNPRHQRVIDTAEFVLNLTKGSGDEHQEFHTALQAYRQFLSGIK